MKKSEDIKDSDYRIRWDKEKKKFVKVSFEELEELEYDRIRKEHQDEKD